MNTKLIERMPSWVYDMTINPDQYATVLTDDMDSYLSCQFLKERFGIEIYGLYDFGKGTTIAYNAIVKPKKLRLFCSLSGRKN